MSTFYVRTYRARDVRGERIDCDAHIYDALEPALKDTRRRLPHKLRRMTFQPLAADARFRVIVASYAPAIDIVSLLAFRWVEKRGGVKGRDVSRLAKRNREYRRALREMPLPASLVSLPPQFRTETIGAPEESPLTRGDALEAVASMNRATVEKRRERTKGIYCPWSLAVEIGEPIPVARAQNLVIGGIGSKQIGTLESTTVNPIRVAQPTEAELDAYRIEWAKYLPTANA